MNISLVIITTRVLKPLKHAGIGSLEPKMTKVRQKGLARGREDLSSTNSRFSKVRFLSASIIFRTETIFFAETKRK